MLEFDPRDADAGRDDRFDAADDGLAPAAEIVCIDCGGRAFLLTPAPEDGIWAPGDIVAYRCQDCNDRWDLELPDDE